MHLRIHDISHSAPHSKSVVDDFAQSEVLITVKRQHDWTMFGSSCVWYDVNCVEYDVTTVNLTSSQKECHIIFKKFSFCCVPLSDFFVTANSFFYLLLNTISVCAAFVMSAIWCYYSKILFFSRFVSRRYEESRILLSWNSVQFCFFETHFENSV